MHQFSVSFDGYIETAKSNVAATKTEKVKEKAAPGGWPEAVRCVFRPDSRGGGPEQDHVGAVAYASTPMARPARAQA